MILNINKPKGKTSFQIVAAIRNSLRHKRGTKKVKVGHAGTLDPLATGVLIVLTDSDTKKQDKIMKTDKQYRAQIAFGAASPSYDLEEIIEVKVVPSVEQLDAQIDSAIQKYVGEIEQTVPFYSAAKVEGKRLYKTARSGFAKEVELPVKEVFIKSITINQVFEKVIDQDGQKITLPVIDITVDCSSGTYIRSLAHDLGNDLGYGGVLVELVRTKVGLYNIEGSITLDDAINSL